MQSKTVSSRIEETSELGFMMQARFEQIVQNINPEYKLLRTWQLEGGISAQIIGLEIVLADGQIKKLLLRRHGDADFNGNPQIAAQEYKLLQFLQKQGIPVAKPYYLDESSELLGRPYLVLDYIEGSTEFSPVNLETFIMQFAANLAKIHSIDLSNSDLSLRYKRDDIYRENFRDMPAKPDEDLQESLIRETLATACPLVQMNKSTILHGDYWLGNILWKDGQLVAIIDWEDAVFGDPLADLANSRLELSWALGNEAMQQFTAQYRAKMSHLDYENLPYWDLWAALRPIAQFSDWAQDEATRKLWRERHLLFSTQALDALQ